MEPYFARYGISGPQWGVLRALQRAEAEGMDGLQLGKLGQRLLVRPPSVTAIVDRLERSGLVARRPDPTDQRAKQVALTTAGRELVARVLVGHPAQIRRIMAGLSPTEQQTFCQLMERLATHLESCSTAGAPNGTPALEETRTHESGRSTAFTAGESAPAKRKGP